MYNKLISTDDRIPQHAIIPLLGDKDTLEFLAQANKNRPRVFVSKKPTKTTPH